MELVESKSANFDFEVPRILYEPVHRDKNLGESLTQKELIGKCLDGQLAPSQILTLLMPLGHSPHATTIDWLIQTFGGHVYH